MSIAAPHNHFGAQPSPASSHALLAHFQPVFDRIAAGAIRREQARELAHEPVVWLREAGFGALRVPRNAGGFGASLPQLFSLIRVLGAADSNLPQIWRAHFGFVEALFQPDKDAVRDRWFARIVDGAVFGAAMAERGPATENTVRITPTGDGDWRLDGSKYYSTGSLYADWLSVSAAEGDDHLALAVPADVDGVERIDDWDGFGQQLTGSGTTHFHGVRLSQEHILSRQVSSEERPDSYLTAFYQTVHLATLAGMADAIRQDAISFVQARTRVFGVPGQASPRQDPLVQRVVGRLASIAFAADSLVRSVAEPLQLIHEAASAGNAQTSQFVQTDLAVWQAQQVLIPLVLEAANLLFEVGGASATSRSRALDRHWRNARTLASHNPAILRERALGDYYLNGVRPREAWFNGRVTPGGATLVDGGSLAASSRTGSTGDSQGFDPSLAEGGPA